MVIDKFWGRRIPVYIQRMVSAVNNTRGENSIHKIIIIIRAIFTQSRCEAKALTVLLMYSDWMDVCAQWGAHRRSIAVCIYIVSNEARRSCITYSSATRILTHCCTTATTTWSIQCRIWRAIHMTEYLAHKLCRWKQQNIKYVRIKSISIIIFIKSKRKRHLALMAWLHRPQRWHQIKC